MYFLPYADGSAEVLATVNQSEGDIIRVDEESVKFCRPPGLLPAQRRISALPPSKHISYMSQPEAGPLIS